MLIHCPELTADQIAEWMRTAAARAGDSDGSLRGAIVYRERRCAIIIPGSISKKRGKR